MSTAAPPTAPTVAPLIQLLRQQADVIEQLTDQQYTAKPVGPVDGSIGGHVRHCLDHVRALIGSAETGALDYDHRNRDITIENSRLLALRLIRELERQLLGLTDAIDHPLDVTILLSPDEPPAIVQSSVGRELAYVLSHTVHHNALIGAMVKTLGGWLPEHFGYAPSTIAYWKSKACAP